MNNYQNYSGKLINNKQHEKQKQRLVLKNIYMYIYIKTYFKTKTDKEKQW